MAIARLRHLSGTVAIARVSAASMFRCDGLYGHILPCIIGLWPPRLSPWAQTAVAVGDVRPSTWHVAERNYDCSKQLCRSNFLVTAFPFTCYKRLVIGWL